MDLIEVNDALVNDPTLANADPYGQGWMVVLKPEDWDTVKPTLTVGAQVQAPYEAKMAADGLEFGTHFAKPPHGLRADQRALRQMLINLLSNAVKFTPPGGRIAVKADIDRKGRFVLSVSDTGIGIAKEDQPKVLLPFNKVDSRLSRK